jgi:succinate dehydrogenase / fumarate reductase cytochrome b subunit
MANPFTSTLGKKFVMAVTGAVLFLFVAGHLVGNLQIFLGPEAINRYGHFLQSNVELIWPVRLSLLLMVGLHLWSATALTRENRAARPVPYAHWQPTAASYASQTMLMSGLIVAAFILYHLLHYTAQVPALNLTGQDFHTLTDAEGRHDVYRMMITGFSRPLVSLFYLVAIGLLCLHLSHGVGAMFQSLGLKNHAYETVINLAAKGVAAAIFLGYSSIPIAVLCGFGRGGCCP